MATALQHRARVGRVFSILVVVVRDGSAFDAPLQAARSDRLPSAVKTRCATAAQRFLPGTRTQTVWRNLRSIL